MARASGFIFMSKPLAKDVVAVLENERPATVCEHLVQEPFGTMFVFYHVVFLCSRASLRFTFQSVSPLCRQRSCPY